MEENVSGCFFSEHSVHSRGQTSAFCCQYGRISQATGWLPSYSSTGTSQHTDISINSKHMQINKWSDWLLQCTKLVFAVFHVKLVPFLRYYCKNHSRYRHYRGVFLNIRSHSRGIPAGFVPVTAPVQFSSLWCLHMGRILEATLEHCQCLWSLHMGQQILPLSSTFSNRKAASQL